MVVQCCATATGLKITRHTRLQKPKAAPSQKAASRSFHRHRGYKAWLGSRILREACNECNCDFLELRSGKHVVLASIIKEAIPMNQYCCAALAALDAKVVASRCSHIFLYVSTASCGSHLVVTNVQVLTYKYSRTNATPAASPATSVENRPELSWIGPLLCISGNTMSKLL